jgi:TolB-like protein
VSAEGGSAPSPASLGPSRPGASGNEDVLDSWKQIAAYLHRDVRTIQRWERTRGLPVHRWPGGEKPAVYALRTEIDAWRRSDSERDVRATAGTRQRLPHAITFPDQSVAVLPFANLSADPENEYFSDGLADEIITALTRIPGLRVTARTSSFAFRGRALDVREIGSRLGVRAVLEGSVQRSEGRVRVSAQLVNVGDGFHLWSERYDRDLADVFAIQDEISRAIAAALRVRLAPLPHRCARGARTRGSSG